MGELVDGRWQTMPLKTGDADGTFRRKASTFRHWVTAGGEAGPSGEGGFRAEAGRYHLYVSLACPWACRALIMRRLKGLEGVIGLSVVHWLMAEDGWTFDPGEGVVPDTVNGARRVYELYALADPTVTTRATVPILWDRTRQTIVSNESADIIRMMNSAFDDVGAAPGDYYPEVLRPEIDAVNARVYETVNNGVYRAGFATSQSAYDAAVTALFDTLDRLEGRLARADFLVGDRLTEADIRLFTTLIRFDAVSHGHFKCNVRPLTDYPNLWAYTRGLYQNPAIRPTVDMDHIKRHYYMSHRGINPLGIVPRGPDLDLEAPSSKTRF